MPIVRVHRGLRGIDRLSEDYSWMFYPPPYQFLNKKGVKPYVEMYAPAKYMGMGAATCPSVQQLMGVADPNDPCQGGAVSTSGSDVDTQNIANYFYEQGMLNAPPAPSQTFQQFLAANQTPILYAGLGLAALAVFRMMK